MSDPTEAPIGPSADPAATATDAGAAIGGATTGRHHRTPGSVGTGAGAVDRDRPEGSWPAMIDRRWLVRAGLTLARHPALWWTALRQLLVLAPAGWWRRAPHLPLPDPAYLAFRLQTAYGDPDRPPEPADLVTYLHWCRAWPYR